MAFHMVNRVLPCRSPDPRLWWPGLPLFASDALRGGLPVGEEGSVMT